MVSKLRDLAIAGSALAIVIAPLAQAADEASTQIEQMRDAVRDLQDQVSRQQEQIDEQAERLADAEAAATSDTSSGSSVSHFLEATEIHSWINVNYAFNSRGNGNDHLIGQNSNTGFHDDNHTFQVDQLWFQLDKPVSSESRAGFHADIAFGETARNAQLAFGGNDSVVVYTAYASYLAPGGYGGIRIDAGELWTLLGAEQVPVSGNLNITRGMVWNLQPVSHTGAIVRTSIGPVSLAFGAVNAVVSDAATDSDRNKALTGQIAFEAERWDIAASFIHGSRLGQLEDSDVPIDPAEPDGPFYPENSDRGDHSDLTIADLVITGDPTPETTFYVNFDYVWSHPKGSANSDTFGVAVAGRYAFSDQSGLSMRFEVVVTDPSNAKSDEEYSLTTTYDYAITDNLTARGEARFDWGIDGKYQKAGASYSSTGGSNHQNLFLAEVIYSF
ncbi:MAG: outer membrane beta-barrel protein [bacterium]|nr:outer membrane beta-barrel protein [bacterium]